MNATASSLTRKVLTLTVIITGLGYFIDMFDMFLFNMLRVPSLTEFGLKGAALTEAGLWVSNFQWAGFILGAWLSGISGDKFGRKKMLFYSVLAYSIGSLLSACAHGVADYAFARFVTGLGLSGELGAGITLITERLSSDRRGLGVMVFIVLGFVGVVLAAIAAEFMYWRHAYLLGGTLGLLLFLTRLWLSESRMYETMSQKKIKRGSLRLVLRKHGIQYLCGILIVTPLVFIPQIVWTLSPEIGKAMGIHEAIKPNIILGIGYSCVIVGDLIASFTSEILRSRKKTILICLLLGIIIFIKYIFWSPRNLWEFYIWNGLLGIAFGAWVVGSVWIAENFATNIRSTATTTIPNFSRAMTIPMNMAYGALKFLGSLTAVATIGIAIFTLSYLGWMGLTETYGKDVAYLEE